MADKGLARMDRRQTNGMDCATRAVSIRGPRLHSVNIKDYARRGRPLGRANERGGRMKFVAFRYASEVRVMARWFFAIVVLALGVAGCQTSYPLTPLIEKTADY